MTPRTRRQPGGAGRITISVRGFSYPSGADRCVCLSRQQLGAEAAQQDAAAADSVTSAGRAGGRGGVPVPVAAGPVQVRAEAAARSPHARRSDMLTSGAARAPAGSQRRGARGAAAGQIGRAHV